MKEIGWTDVPIRHHGDITPLTMHRKSGNKHAYLYDRGEYYHVIEGTIIDGKFKQTKSYEVKNTFDNHQKIVRSYPVDSKFEYIVKESGFESRVIEANSEEEAIMKYKNKMGHYGGAMSVRHYNDSKRKKPIKFKRSSTPRAPRGSKPVGPGKGWHKQPARHSIASKKGWRNRR